MTDNLWCEGLDFEDWEEKHENNDEIMDYLHGNCHIWVENNYQEGDKCVAILEERENKLTMCLMHSCLLRDGKFVDVRGDTSDFNAILEAFDWGDYEVVECDNLEQFKGVLEAIMNEMITMKYIEDIITFVEKNIDNDFENEENFDIER